MSVPTSRRRNPIASTIPLALAAEETLEEAARRLADAAPAEEGARYGGRERRVGAHVGPADRPAGAERDGEPPTGVHQHGPRLRLAEDVVGERREASRAGRAAGERGRRGRRAGERAVQLERPDGARPILRPRQLRQLEAARVELGGQPSALPLAAEMRRALDGAAERLERRRLEV